MTAARAGDAVCLLLAVVAVLDVVQLGLEPLPVVLAAQVGMWALLLLRHVSLLPVLLVPVVPVLLGVVAPGTNDDTVVQLCAVAFAAFVVGRRGSAAAQAAGGALVVLGTLAIELQHWPLDRTDVGDVFYVNGPALLALALGARLTQREQERADLVRLQQQLTDELAADARAAVAEERERIRRELQDVVAQGAGAVIAQASAARLLLDLDRADDAGTALEAVEQTTRDALDDMRRLLGVLRDQGDHPVGVAP